VKWPEDFPDEAQRGKTKPVRVELTRGEAKSLPALDDAFARELGDFDSSTRCARRCAGPRAARGARGRCGGARSSCSSRSSRPTRSTVPPSWVAQLVQATPRRTRSRRRSARFAQEFGPMAERQVRRDLIIETIAEREGWWRPKRRRRQGRRDGREARRSTRASCTRAAEGRAAPELERSITEERCSREYLLERTEQRRSRVASVGFAPRPRRTTHHADDLSRRTSSSGPAAASAPTTSSRGC
jgi:trigger factor